MDDRAKRIQLVNHRLRESLVARGIIGKEEFPEFAEETVLEPKPQEIPAPVAIRQPRRNGSTSTKVEGLVGTRATRELAGKHPFVVDSTGAVQRERQQGKNPDRVLDEALTFDPDASLTLYNMQRLAFPGEPTIQCFSYGAEGPTADAHDEARILCEQFCSTVAQVYGGGLKNLAHVMMRYLLGKGAIAGELELTEAVDEVIDIWPVNPRLVELKYEKADGSWEYGVRTDQGQEFVALPAEQFRYIPLDPEIERPYGQTPLAPALRTLFFVTEVRDAFFKAARQQGFARIGIRVLTAQVQDAAEKVLGEMATEEEKISYINQFFNDIKTEIEGLDPDSAWIHPDWAEPSHFGAAHGAQSFPIEAVAKVLDQWHIAALKTLPTLMGRQWGAALSTTGSIEWQVYALGVEAMRDVIHRFFSWALTQFLRVKGIPAYAVVSQEPIRKQDRVAEAQALATEVTAWGQMVDRGWASDDEAALELLGHDAVLEIEFDDEDDEPEGPEPEETEEEEPEAEVEESYSRNGHGGHRTLAEIRAQYEHLLAQVGSSNGCGCEADRHPFDLVSTRGLRGSATEYDWDRWATKRRGTRQFYGMMSAEPMTGDWRSQRHTRNKWYFHEDSQTYMLNRRPYSSSQVRNIHELRMSDDAAKFRRMVLQHQRGEITADQLDQRGRRLIDKSNRLGMSMAVGGDSGMKGRGQRLSAHQRGQLRHWSKFMNDVKSGRAAGSKARNRAAMYATAGPRAAYQDTRLESHVDAGFNQARRQLNSAVPCRTCEDDAARGWVSIGDLVPLGSTLCNGADKCDFVYRRWPPSPQDPIPRSMMPAVRGRMDKGDCGAS